jgi:hypothetical protein
VDWIEGRTGELDAKEDVFQLDHRSGASVLLGNYGECHREAAIPHANGDFTVAAAGIAADITLTEMSVDVTWHAHAQDRLDGLVALAGSAPCGLYRAASHANGRRRIS